MSVATIEAFARKKERDRIVEALRAKAERYAKGGWESDAVWWRFAADFVESLSASPGEGER